MNTMAGSEILFQDQEEEFTEQILYGAEKQRRLFSPCTLL